MSRPGPGGGATPARFMVTVLAVALPIALVTSGCSLSHRSTCEDLQELATNVRGLGELDLVHVGTDGLDEQLGKIEASWKKVLRSAGSQFGPELRRLQAAVEALLATLRTGSSGPGGLGEALPRLQQEVADVESAWDSLTTAVSSELSDCDLG